VTTDFVNASYVSSKYLVDLHYKTSEEDIRSSIFSLYKPDVSNMKQNVRQFVWLLSYVRLYMVNMLNKC